MRTTAKRSIAHLTEICYRKGIRNVIFSPGSRNAPLVIAFSSHGGFNCQTVPDERVAAFVALGQGIATHNPSIICCTSGSAALNYAPAIVEAYYQSVPMLVLTADRPSEWIDQGIGQCMRQENVYANYIKDSFQWIEEALSEKDLAGNDAMASRAIDTTTQAPYGPVHINIPFHEPLYETEEIVDLSLSIPETLTPTIAKNGVSPELLSMWETASKKMILVGLLHPDPQLQEILMRMSHRKDVILVTETTSNISDQTIPCIDRALHGIGEDAHLYKPDLLISIGGPLVSKKIKQFLYEHKPTNHWYINEGNLQDTYRANPIHIQKAPAEVLEFLTDKESNSDDSFFELWEQLYLGTYDKHKIYLANCEYSDLLVFGTIIKHIPDNCNLHLANSTPIRYAQLFEQSRTVNHFSNRGVSGIDGSTSTAIGFAQCNNKLSVLITGDMSFFYDSNAFWIKQLPNNLRIILINNGGGGIFRYIPGPDTTSELESVFESHHELTAEHMSSMYKLPYRNSNTIENISDNLEWLLVYQLECSILEVFTPRLKNSVVLREYFKKMYLK